MSLLSYNSQDIGRLLKIKRLFKNNTLESLRYSTETRLWVGEQAEHSKRTKLKPD